MQPEGTLAGPNEVMVRTILGLLVAVLLAGPPIPQRTVAAGYDPLAVSGPASKQSDLVVRDTARARDIPILIYLPATTGPSPVVLFSHGLGGSREMGVYLGEHWARRGYAAVFLQHPGSDVKVWQNQPRRRALSALTAAANAENFQARVQDVGAVLDQLGRWQKSPGHMLSERLALDRVGMSGHSFGAITTQAVSGERFPTGRIATDPRITAALPMSPSPPQRGSAATAFASVRIPWLVMTGSLDDSPIGKTTPRDRREVFAALPPASKYELVLDGAQHSAFTDRTLPGDRAPRNPAHHRAILALSTAFWDAYLSKDQAARAWLDGAGPREVLQPRDLWTTK